MTTRKRTLTVREEWGRGKELADIATRIQNLSATIAACERRIEELTQRRWHVVGGEATEQDKISWRQAWQHEQQRTNTESKQAK